MLLWWCERVFKGKLTAPVLSSLCISAHRPCPCCHTYLLLFWCQAGYSFSLTPPTTLAPSPISCMLYYTKVPSFHLNRLIGAAMCMINIVFFFLFFSHVLVLLTFLCLVDTVIYIFIFKLAFFFFLQHCIAICFLLVFFLFCFLTLQYYLFDPAYTLASASKEFRVKLPLSST